MYTIKAISSLTGIGAETLRAWERRYQLVAPVRDDGGRRVYSKQDLEKLLLLSKLTRQGHAIGKLSDLSVGNLQELLRETDKQANVYEMFVLEMVDALLNYRIERCEQLLKRALMANEPLVFVKEILGPALILVGDMWHEEKIGIAQEHAFSECVKRILLGMVNNLHTFSENKPGILLATPSGEPHEFGILMCSLLAAEQHYNCYYLGSNLPVADIRDAMRKLKVEIVALGLVKCPPDAETMASVFALADDAESKGTEVWLGGKGAGFWRGQQLNWPKNCRIVNDLDDFYAMAQQKRYAVRKPA